MRRLLTGVLGLAVMIVLGASIARAQTELVISTDGLTMTFTGSSISTGPITLGGWTIDIDTESNSPNLQPDFGIGIDALGVRCTSAPCSTDPLTVMLSSTGFTQETDGFTAGASALRLTGGITFSSDSFWSASNALGGTETAINTHSIVGPVGGGTEVSSGGGLAGPSMYSLTLIDTFTATAVGNSITATASDIAATPEPSTLLLFGSGLLLFGIIIGRKQLHAPERALA